MKRMLGLTAIGLVILLGAVTVGVGQNSPGPLWTDPVAHDFICTNEGTNSCSVPTDECGVSADFGAETHTYHLNVWLECQSVGCDYCMGCARVVDLSTGITACEVHTTTSPTDCNSSTPCDLTAGHTYRLYCCLTNMLVGTPTPTCTQCAAKICEAKAEVTY